MKLLISKAFIRALSHPRLENHISKAVLLLPNYMKKQSKTSHNIALQEDCDAQTE